MSAPAAAMAELLATGASPSGGLDPDELLARLCADRPDLQALLAALKQAPRAERVVAPAIVPGDAERLGRLKIAYAELYERAGDVARALGACVRCWGEDPGCERCGGGGAPGSYVPDPEAFKRYVVPALAAVRAVRAARAPAPASPVPVSARGEHVLAGRDTSSHQTSQGVA